MNRRVALAGAAGIVLAMVCAFGLYLLYGGAAEEAETSTTQRDAAVGAAEQVIDCVTDPTTETTEECEDEAQDAQETIQDKVPPVGLTGRQRREVVLIAAQLITADPDLSEDQVVDAVLDQLPAPEQGPRGPRGPAGEDADAPSTAEIRALVQLVYTANPPAPGQDGTNGTDGSDGADGADGKTGPRGPGCVEELGLDQCRGPAGPKGEDSTVPGPAGQDGAPGRGVATMTCDPESQTFVVTYTDGTSEPVAGSDCVADGPLPALP